MALAKTYERKLWQDYVYTSWKTQKIDFVQALVLWEYDPVQSQRGIALNQRRVKFPANAKNASIDRRPKALCN